MKDILITGSSAGLGRELALTFARKSHGVVIHGRNEARLNALQKEIEGLPPEFSSSSRTARDVRAVRGNLSDPLTITALVRAAQDMEVGVLINNAGEYLSCPSDDIVDDDLERVLDTNLLAPIRLTLAIYPLFKVRRRGLIININSLAGKGYNDREAVYCASKWGLRGFMGSFKFEARKAGVGVLDVYLGKMKTDMSGNQPGAIDPAEAAQLIYGLWLDYPTLRVTEVEIGRSVA